VPKSSAIVRDEFYTKLVGKSAAQMKAYSSTIIFTGRGQPPKALTNGAEVKKRLVENPTAIGYMVRIWSMPVSEWYFDQKIGTKPKATCAASSAVPRVVKSLLVKKSNFDLDVGWFLHVAVLCSYGIRKQSLVFCLDDGITLASAFFQSRAI
jgi:hypothetical protein